MTSLLSLLRLSAVPPAAPAGRNPHPSTQPNAPKAGYPRTIDHKGAKQVPLKGVGE